MQLQMGRSGTLLTTWTAGVENSTAIRVGAVLFIAAATAAAAQVAVPLGFTPVPLTLQDTMVLIGGAALGSRLGMAAQILYLAAGIAGLPVFATSATLPQGPMRLLGPTGGYLWSYPFAAFVVGYLAERGFEKQYFTSCLAMLAGLAVVMTFGVTWLALFAQPVAVGFDSALRLGLYPFLFNDVLKIFLGGALLPGVWKLVRS
jgi:biotin transport system substrate-specific component